MKELDGWVRIWKYTDDESKSEWQSIETAPTDKTEIIVWCGWLMTGIYDGKCFYDDMGVNPIFHVTHWMPLPAPPQENKP